MGKTRQTVLTKTRAAKLAESMDVLRALGFSARQRNEVAGYTLLAMLDLRPQEPWSAASAPLRGITPIIEFIGEFYGVQYAPNTRETIRDEAVKHFVETGLLLRNPDEPGRPTNSGRTVYQFEQSALELMRNVNAPGWGARLERYLRSKAAIQGELARQRSLSRIPVHLPSGGTVTISPGGQNPLIRSVIEAFCPRFVRRGAVVYIGDAENKFLHLEIEYLRDLGVSVPAPAKMPDVVVHDTERNWLLLIEAVASAGPVDGKRRKELKELFSGCRAGLVFVTAFADRHAMRAFLSQFSWESEVWVADDPDHLIHFDGERFLGPYPDVLPRTA